MEVKTKILVVDDEEVICRSVNRILSKDGCTVVEVLNAEIALEKMGKEVFDVAIVDLVMPQVSGMELLGTIKKKWPETEVIIITGRGTSESKIEAMKLGAFDYIPKPFSPRHITVAVYNALSRKAPGKIETLEISSRVDDIGILILNIAGFIDGSNINFFSQQIHKQIEKGYRKIILDCSELKYLNSSALGIILDAHLLTNTHQGGVRILNLPSKIEKTFEILGFTEYFQIFSEENKAQQSFL
ncbi:MAG: anti-sigma factor antagonist [Deltaproteobacteria bacterium]|nr:MAG: anti-sigma factor antagonist [Deltaproteobacteria bacterium]